MKFIEKFCKTKITNTVTTCKKKNIKQNLEPIHKDYEKKVHFKKDKIQLNFQVGTLWTIYFNHWNWTFFLVITIKILYFKEVY